MLRISNHTAWRFAGKTRFFRSLWAGRRCAAASRFTFFKGKTLQSILSLKCSASQTIRPVVLRENAKQGPARLPGTAEKSGMAGARFFLFSIARRRRRKQPRRTQNLAQNCRKTAGGKLTFPTLHTACPSSTACLRCRLRPAVYSRPAAVPGRKDTR